MTANETTMQTHAIEKSHDGHHDDNHYALQWDISAAISHPTAQDASDNDDDTLHPSTFALPVRPRPIQAVATSVDPRVEGLSAYPAERLRNLCRCPEARIVQSTHYVVDVYDVVRTRRVIANTRGPGGHFVMLGRP